MVCIVCNVIIVFEFCFWLINVLKLFSDLEDPLADDVPTTVIRSKADLPNWQANATLSTNDIVIGKLITIFTEWRQSGGKRKRKEATSQELNMKTKNISKANELNELAVSTNRLPTILKEDDIGIYDDIGDYELPQRRARSLSNSSDELQYSKRRSSRHEKSRDFRSSQAKRDYLHGYTSLATNSITDPQEEASLNFDVIRPPSTDSDDEPEKKHESYVPMKSNSNFTCAQNQSTDSSNSPSPTRSMSLSPVAKRSRHRRAASSRSSSNSSRSSSRSKTRSNRGDRSSRRRTRSRSKDRKHRSSSEHRSRRRSRSSERYRSDRDRSSHHSLHYPKTASSSRHRSRR